MLKLFQREEALTRSELRRLVSNGAINLAITLS